ncbi:MAG: glycosyltransferase family 9 protein [Deltaproteobacteria bacterium]|nr:glycosyltransferase family 9 protein [Deltaproteobacteria bacterium]
MSSNAPIARPILVIFPGALGDLICAVPALRAIARRHPDSPCELMARAELARFATGRLGLAAASSYATDGLSEGHARGHSIDRREVAHLFAARGDPDAISSEARAFFGAFAHVYSFFASDDAHFRSALASATDGRASFIPFRPPGEGHVAAAYLRELGALGALETGANPSVSRTLSKTPEDDESLLDCSIELYREDIDLAEDRLTSLGLDIGKYLLVLPGSGSIAKNWPSENFIALAIRLASRIPSLVVIGPAEAALEPIFAASGLPMLAHLELAEVAALARLSAAFVGNDSGVSHLAAATGAHGLALFGSTDLARWRPLGRATVIRHEPLDALLPDEVAAAISEIIGAK